MISLATLVDPLDLSIDLSIRDSLTYNVSCFGICDGWALATASGGTGVYTYIWSDGQTMPRADSLCAGSNYTVSVTDANGCDESSTTITFTQPPAFEAFLPPSS